MVVRSRVLNTAGVSVFTVLYELMKRFHDLDRQSGFEWSSHYVYDVEMGYRCVIWEFLS